MSHLMTELDKFIIPDNIKYVENTGNVRSKSIVVLFGDIDFREKDYIGTSVNLATIFNSLFNRDLNLHNDEILADKVRYALEIISGCAKIGLLPVSYIHDLPLWKQGGIAHLHLKDRGHTTFILSHLDYKVPLRVWRRVVQKLEENNLRGSDTLMKVRDAIVSQLDVKLVNEFSIADVTTKEMRDNLRQQEVTVEVSIESLENHRIEIINTNNSGNRWSTHMYGQIVLQSLLAMEDEPVLDIDDLYNAVKNLDVFLAKRTFLSGFKSTIDRHYGHEDEILMFYIGCRLLQESRNPKDKNVRYLLFEKTENVENREEMFRLIYIKYIKTAELKTLAKMWDRVAESPRWDTFAQRIQTIVEDIQVHGYVGSIKNFTDIIPIAPRAALRWFDMINDLQTELKWGSDVAGLTTEVISTALSLLQYPEGSDPMENPVINSLKLESTSRATREDFFYSVLHKKMVEKFKNSKGARESKTSKLLSLRAHLTEHGFNKRRFQVIDRKRDTGYVITEIDLMTGKGLELGHKVAGAEFTDKNTFLQFPNDNRFNSAHDITNGYWIDYGSWVTDMKEKYPDVDEEAFEDTLTFCSIMADKLI